MGKLTFCVSENNVTDQFRHFKTLTIFFVHAPRFVSDLLGKQNVGFLISRLKLTRSFDMSEIGYND